VNTPDFEAIAGGDDLDEREREQLLAAHEALLEAGPLPELPPNLANAPRMDRGEVVKLPNTRRRATILIAAAIALVAFALGAVTNGKDSGAFAAAWSYRMHGTANAPQAKALLEGSAKDASGNWTMRLTTTGLPQLQGIQYYEVWLTKNGKPVAQCGSFVVGSGTTVATFAEPYHVKAFDGWVVTLWRGPKSAKGPALLQTKTI
jgi:hypothetical protein